MDNYRNEGYSNYSFALFACYMHILYIINFPILPTPTKLCRSVTVVSLGSSISKWVGN